MAKTATLLFLLILPLHSHAQTLKEKIGQMIMVGVDNSQTSQDSLLYDIEHRNLGGVLLFAYNLGFPSQIKSQNARFQEKADTPLLLAIDQEGGIVARLDEQNGYKQTYTAYELGTEFNSEDSTRAQASLMADWMATAGLNMNLAPVADVNINPDSPAIGRLDRSFSEDEYTVFLHTSWFADEFHKKGIATSLKHFPGHGSAEDDSHNGLTDITNTWQPRELDPFKFIIESGYNDAIMTGHLVNNNWDDIYPTSLSHHAVTTILRDSLGFNGVVISDELFMQAITDNFELEETVTTTINAGTDILLYSTNLYEERSLAGYLVNFISKKVEDGEILESTIDASYNRILNLKDRRTLTNIKTEPLADLPSGISISNYPNPFNPTTTISITLEKPSRAEIYIVNSLGQKVQTISQGHLSSGVHDFRFDGSSLSSGLYFTVVQTDSHHKVHKIMLIK